MSPTIQQAGIATQPAPTSSTPASQRFNGAFKGLEVTALKSVSSPIPDAQDAQDAIEGKSFSSLKGRLKNGKKEEPAKQRKTKEGNKADSANLAEEKAMLAKLLKNLSKNEEELDEDEKKERDELLQGMGQDFNQAGEKLLHETVAFLKEEKRDNIYSDKINQLNRQLDIGRKEGKGVSQEFWQDLSNLSSKLKIGGFSTSGKALPDTVFLDSPGKLHKFLKQNFQHSKIEYTIALHVKDRGHQLDKVNNNDSTQLQVAIKELMAAKTLASINDKCNEIETILDRMVLLDKNKMT